MRSRFALLRNNIPDVTRRVGVESVQPLPKGNTMLFNVRTAADFRALLYTLLPIVSTLLVGYGVVTDDKVKLWAALATAVLGPVVAAINARTVSAFRTAFYAVLGAAQAIVVGYGIANDAQFATWMPLVVALVGAAAGGVAAANTDTTPAAG